MVVTRNNGGTSVNQVRTETPIDAITSTPDAITSTPDAITSTPDAITSTPDAITSTPDAITPQGTSLSPSKFSTLTNDEELKNTDRSMEDTSKPLSSSGSVRGLDINPLNPPVMGIGDTTMNESSTPEPHSNADIVNTSTTANLSIDRKQATPVSFSLGVGSNLSGDSASSGTKINDDQPVTLPVSPSGDIEGEDNYLNPNSKRDSATNSVQTFMTLLPLGITLLGPLALLLLPFTFIFMAARAIFADEEETKQSRETSSPLASKTLGTLQHQDITSKHFIDHLLQNDKIEEINYQTWSFSNDYSLSINDRTQVAFPILNANAMVIGIGALKTSMSSNPTLIREDETLAAFTVNPFALESSGNSSKGVKQV